MNIREEVYSILSGKYKNFHRAWLFALFLIFYFFLPIPVSAFSDNFDASWGGASYSTGTTTPNGWYVVAGTWYQSGTSSFGGNSINYTYASTSTPSETHTINKNVGSGNQYFSIKIKHDNPTVGCTNLDAIWYFQSNGSNKQGLKVCDNTLVNVGFTGYSSQTINTNTWYKIEVTLVGSNAEIKLSNETELLNTQNIGYVSVVNANIVELSVYDIANPANMIGRFDDVVATGTSPGTTATLSWGSSAYTAGDTLRFDWAMSDAEWNYGWLTNHFILIFKDGAPYYAWSREVCFILVCTISQNYYDQVPQTGTYYFTPADSETGTYTAILSRGFGTGFYGTGFYGIINANTSLTSPTPAYLTSSPQVAARIPFNVSYNFGRGGIITPVIQVNFMGTSLESYTQLSSLPSGTTTVTVNQAGSYTLKLMDLYTGKVYKSALVTAVLSIPLATLNITNSSLSIDKTVYNWGDLMVGSFAIDSANFTAGISYLDIYNYDISGVTAEYFDFNVGCEDGSCQIGNFMNQITPYKPATATTTKILYIGGNNSVRLMIKFSNGTTRLLSRVNFTLNDVDPYGYMLKLNKNDVLTNEVFYATIKVPDYNNTLIIRNLIGGTIVYTTTLNYSASSISKALSIKDVGAYEVTLINSLGSEVRTTPVNVRKDISTPTPTPITPTGGQKATDIANLLSSNVFWSFLIIAGLMIGVGANFKNKEPILPVSITGLIGLFAFSLVGWMPWSVTYGVVILIFVVFAWQQSDKMKA